MSDIITTRTFVDGEKNITATKLNDIVGSSVIQPAFVSSKPVASAIAAGDNMLLLTAAGAYAQVPFQTVVSSVEANLGNSQIWDVRLRSFNAAGNPTMEVSQRNLATSLAVVPNAFSWPADRWAVILAGTLRASAQQMAGNVVVPGTNFNITQNFLRITITTAASLAAGDYLAILQNTEGIGLRELLGDVHSCSVLARSNVANLAFSVGFVDNPITKSLTKLCTLGAANTWTLITLPNLPIWASGGNWRLNPGQIGYSLYIALASGASQLNAANDTWQNTTAGWAAVGIGNLAATSGATFDLAFVQHEPGAVCSTPMDLPFARNLDECLRFYQKTYSYLAVPGTATMNGLVSLPSQASYGSVNGSISFRKVMAKAPQVNTYHENGTINYLATVEGSQNLTTSVQNIGDSGFYSINVSPNIGNTGTCRFHYIADTGY